MFFFGSFLKPLFSQLLEYIEYICEEQVKRTKGFVLQVQQGVSHEKSHMQVAEAQQSGPGWLNVLRIAVFALEDNGDIVGGGNYARARMRLALAKAEAQWTNEIKAEVEMCSERYEPVDGADKVPTDFDGRVHGMAKCTYPKYNHPNVMEGAVYVGEYRHGDPHGQGTCNYASGHVYIGEFQYGQMHGKGKYTYPNGDFSLGFFVYGVPSNTGVRFTGDPLGFNLAGKVSVESVRFSKDRQKVQLFKDGEFAQELSLSEAAKKVEELGLSELLKWVLDPIRKDFGRRKVTKSCQMLSSCQRSEQRVVYYFDRKSNWNLGVKIIALSCSVCHVSISKKGIHVTKWDEMASGFLRNVLLKYHSSHNHGSEKWVPPIVVTLPLKNRHFPLPCHYGRKSQNMLNCCYIAGLSWQSKDWSSPPIARLHNDSDRCASLVPCRCKL